VGAVASTRARDRSVPLAAVVILHVCIGYALLVGYRAHDRVTTAENAALTLVNVPEVQAPKPQPPAADQQIKLAPHAPPALSIEAPAPIRSGAPSGPVDWRTEAHRTASDILEDEAPPPEVTREKSHEEDQSRDPPPAHYAGETYRTNTGESVVWISAKCYVISPAPNSGPPDVGPRPQMTRTVCPREGNTARGDLFKSVPGYKKRLTPQ
jgi:hypothetical protein